MCTAGPTRYLLWSPVIVCWELVPVVMEGGGRGGVDVVGIGIVDVWCWSY